MKTQENVVTLQFKILMLPPEDTQDVSKYPTGDGLYIVNDGFGHHLISILDKCIRRIPLPNKEILEQYKKSAQDDVKQTQRDILIALENKIEHIGEVLDVSLTEITEVITTMSGKKQESVIDLGGLTKLVAVAQNPDLLKGK